MNEVVINELGAELSIKKEQIEAVLKLLGEGSTIPFIARYRKEATGALDENQIAKIEEKYAYYNNLMERKEQVIRLIDEKGMLTEEIKANILACTKLVDVEDIYLPYKEKKKTKATEADDDKKEDKKEKKSKKKKKDKSDDAAKADDKKEDKKEKKSKKKKDKEDKKADDKKDDSKKKTKKKKKDKKDKED